jgi:hypothetical protein
MRTKAMVTTQKRLRRTALKLSLAAIGCATFGAVVIAGPSGFVSRSTVSHEEVASLQPLAVGPALQLAKAKTGESEDCVRVTSMTGPDGKQYPTRGLVCGGND